MINVAKSSLPTIQVAGPVDSRLHKTRSVEALALDGRLDKIALCEYSCLKYGRWLKDCYRRGQGCRT